MYYASIIMGMGCYYCCHCCCWDDDEVCLAWKV